jgi:formate-dependent nitrite reductase membrane component NrfD
MGFIVMLLSFIIGVIMITLSSTVIKNKIVSTSMTIIGILLVIFAVYLALPR